MMRDRKYGGNGRLKTPSPPRQRRFSPPPGRIRDSGYSPPRGRDMEEERRVGRYSRRDHDRCYESYDHRGGRDHKRGFNRGYGEYNRSFSRGDREHDSGFSRGGARVSDYDVTCDRDREMDGGRSQSMYKPTQPTSDDGEHPRRMYQYGELTSSKFQWDHLLDEPRKSDGFKGSLDHGPQGSGLRSELKYDFERSNFFDAKPAFLEAERGRVYSSPSYQTDVGLVPRSSGLVEAARGDIPLPSQLLNSSSRDLDKLVADGPMGRDPLRREAYMEDNPLRYSRADIDYTLSSSRSKLVDAVPPGSFKEDIPGSLRKDLRIPPDRGGIISGNNPIGYDAYSTKSRTRSPVDRDGRLVDFRSYALPYLSRTEERHLDFTYPEASRRERNTVGTRSTESYGKLANLGETYGRQDVSRMGILQPVMDKVDGSSYQGYSRGNRPWDHTPNSLGSASDYSDAHGSMPKRRQDVGNQNYESPRSVYDRESYHGQGSSGLSKLHHDYEAAGSSWFVHKQTDRLTIGRHDSPLGNAEGISKQELEVDDVRRLRPSKKMFKRRHDIGNQGSKHVSEMDDPGDAAEPWRDDMASNFLSKKLKFTNFKYEKARKVSTVMSCRHVSSGANSLSEHSHIRKPHTGTRNIKERLGPGPQKVPISQRLTKKYKPSLKKRLGPAPQMNYVTPPPWLKNLKAPKLLRFQDASNGSHFDQGEERQEDNNTPANPEPSKTKPKPPENSEDFRQMVLSAFFKFVKQLNETPAKRRKYKEQGKAGGLKCIVCGSGSEEFGDTESLAIHAFTSQKIGVRSQHLGLHKALCALTGWKSAEASDTTWICETLSRSENLLLKEDLILWPPVVIVHNSTIGDKTPDQRVIVSNQELEDKLKDMGFGDKMKVYRGKPANEGIMVVQFGGTLSGLQEAERLHKIYFDAKHGRDEFLWVKSCNNGGHNQQTEVPPVDKVENILYGYLGIAEDLYRLDFDIKKRCLIKSKKDIQNIAKAPLGTE